MNFFKELSIVLLKIIISNVIIVYSSNELSQNIENHILISVDDLKKLIWEYPSFIKLTLQQQDYYTGKDVARCPMPYNEKTVLDDPDVAKYKFFNPRKCDKPWTWTYKNYVDVPVPINGTIGQKLGNIIQPCLKENTNIVQCYTHYLNAMESVGLTLVDRFCLFVLEVFNRFDKMKNFVDFMEEFTLFDININVAMVNTVVEKFYHLLCHICSTFKRYYISTLSLDCVKNALMKINLRRNEYGDNNENAFNEHYKRFSGCRKTMKSKRNYAILDSDQYWDWDSTSDCKPDDKLIILTQYENINLGIRLFAYDK